MKNNTFFLKIATNTLLSDNWYEVSKRVAVNDTIRIWMTKLSQNCNLWKLWFLFSCNTHASNESKALSKQNMKSCFNQSQSKFSMNSFPLFDRNFIIIIFRQTEFWCTEEWILFSQCCLIFWGNHLSYIIELHIINGMYVLHRKNVRWK